TRGGAVFVQETYQVSSPAAPSTASSLVVDFHTHIFPPEVIRRRDDFADLCPRFAALYRRPTSRLATAEQLIDEMDASGVDVSVVLGFDWTSHTLCRLHNDYLLDALRRYPGRLVAFASINPLAGDLAIAELERCVEGGMRGIGELNPEAKPFHYDDVGVLRPLFEFAAAHRLIVLTHASEPTGHVYPGKGTCTPDVLARMVERFPDNVFVLAHCGGGLPFYELMPEVGRALQKTYYDTAAWPYLYEDRVFAALVALVGAGRVLWGTDYPLLRQRRLLERVRRMELPLEVERAILGGNAAALLGLVPAVDDGRGP
ncbi:MAG TPA: amidohydrolase family protein, partial [Chloroflexota bacterium]